jgi:hypothetical protein
LSFHEHLGFYKRAGQGAMALGVMLLYDTHKQFPGPRAVKGWHARMLTQKGPPQSIILP